MMLVNYNQLVYDEPAKIGKAVYKLNVNGEVKKKEKYDVFLINARTVAIKSDTRLTVVGT